MGSVSTMFSLYFSGDRSEELNTPRNCKPIGKLALLISACLI